MLGSVHAGYINAAYVAGAGMKANGDYGLVTYPWDLSDKSNPEPATQKTSLVEVLSPFSASLTAGYSCLLFLFAEEWQKVMGQSLASVLLTVTDTSIHARECWECSCLRQMLLHQSALSCHMSELAPLAVCGTASCV